MREIVDVQDKIKRYYTFTKSEIKGIVISVLVIAFIISFRDWGHGDQIDLIAGLFNLLNSILIVLLSFIIHISAQRIWSLMTGYKLEWKMWGFGLMAGLIIAFLTNGKFWLILPGGFVVHHMAGHRLGWFRYGINWWAIGLIALMGPLASIIFALVFKAISGIIINSLITKIIAFNVAYALYSLLPIPPLDGSRMFFGSRMTYVFSVFGIISASALISLNASIGITIISSIFIGFVLWLLYYVFIEHKLWFGG